jgi:hypothetical protein
MGDSTPKRKLPGHPKRRVSRPPGHVVRNTNYMKPEGFADYLTITELSVSVDRDISWLRKLEADGKIPAAHRVKVGKLSVRLWSPAQRDEIEIIVNSIKRGRPPGR